MKDEQRPARNSGAARASDTPRRTTRAARQLDVFAGRDVRGTPRQLDLFGAPGTDAARTLTGEVAHGT